KYSGALDVLERRLPGIIRSIDSALIGNTEVRGTTGLIEEKAVEDDSRRGDPKRNSWPPEIANGEWRVMHLRACQPSSARKSPFASCRTTGQKDAEEPL